MMEIKLVNNSKNNRLDHFLCENTNFNRTKIINFIKNSYVSVNGILVTKQGHLLKENDFVLLKVHELDKHNDNNKIFELNDSLDNQTLNIVYEDKDFLIINKPNNVLVYPTYIDDKNTLAHSLRDYFNLTNNNEFKNDLRQGIVHRLDRKTTGLVLVAKNYNMYNLLKKMMLENKIKRIYTCIVHHHFKQSDLNKKIKIDTYIGIDKSGTYKMKVGHDCKNAKQAITIITPKENIGASYAIVENDLITGRTHQVRVHMRYINHPIINDEVYGIDKSSSSFGQYLMCNNISFIHPISNKIINISIPLEKEFISKINQLKNE